MDDIKSKLIWGREALEGLPPDAYPALFDLLKRGPDGVKPIAARNELLSRGLIVLLRSSSPGREATTSPSAGSGQPSTLPTSR